MKLPRGIRNNNPGNLVITRIPWKGKVPRAKNTDGKFEQFVAMEYGLRAMMMDVRGDIVKDGKNTIRTLITEYAPKWENNTLAYINVVAKKVNLKPDQIIPVDKNTMTRLIEAIITHENGGLHGITMAQIEKAWDML
jgi:hypothetical protein